MVMSFIIMLFFWVMTLHELVGRSQCFEDEDGMFIKSVGNYLQVCTQLHNS